MSHRRNILDSASYSRISCNNSKVVERNKRVYQNKNRVTKRKKKLVKEEFVNKNVLINFEKIITTYEINHNNYRVYNNYIDMINKQFKQKTKNR